MTSTPSIREISAAAAVDFTDSWYDESGPEHFWMRWRFRSWLRLTRELGVSLDSPLRALDIGGGIGVVRRQIESASAWTVDLTELHEGALERCLPGRGDTLRYDILERNPGFIGRYDALLLFDVIEHIASPGAFLDAAAAHLKPGGQIFVNVPALPRLYGAYDEVQGHFRRYHRAMLRAHASEADLTVVRARYWGLSLLPLLPVRKFWLGRLLRRGQTRASIHLRGFRPPGRLASAVLGAAMSIETRLPFPPLGSSLLAALRRPAP